MARFFCFFIVLSFLFPLPVYGSDISGTWTLTMTGPHGEETFDIHIATNGTALTVTTTHPFLGKMKGSGSINGEAVNMNISSTGKMEIELVFEGKVNGNTMAGTRDSTISRFSEYY